MSIEKDKKPRRAPAKKAAASETAEGAKEKKTRGAVKAKTEPAAKKAAPEARTAAKSAEAAGVPQVADAIATPVARSTQRPTHQQIAERAYFLYVERGGKHGHHEQDWLIAERELMAGR